MDAKAIIHKTRNDYNCIAAHFSGTRSRLWGEFAYFKKYIKSGQKILDWGCGNGRLIYCFGKKSVEYFGVDQSIELIKIARVKFKNEIKSGRVKFFCSIGGGKKFPKKYFDLVFMIASFFHLPNVASREQRLKQVYQQMKPGGKLIMTVWNLESAWAKEAYVKKGWTKMSASDYLIPWRDRAGNVLCERYYHSFSKGELRDLLVKSGFKIKEMKLFVGQKQTVAKGGRNLMVEIGRAHV